MSPCMGQPPRGLGFKQVVRKATEGGPHLRVLDPASPGAPTETQGSGSMLVRG